MRSLFILLLLLAIATHGFAGIEPPQSAQEVLSLGLRGVYFVPNQGQWSDDQVIYGLRSRGLDVALRESALTMHLARQSNDASPKRQRGLDTPTSPDRAGVELDAPSPLASEQLTLTITFPGSNAVEPIGAQPQSAKFNYFVGGEGRGVATDVPSFGAVIYQNLYDGVDLHVTGSDDGVLKYEFHCAPGADYNQIRIHYDGIDSLCIDDSGNLHIKTSFGTLADAAPVAWYADDATDSVAAQFELMDTATYRIAVRESIDPHRKFIIDPDLEWMYYLGGSDDDLAYGVSIADAGNVFVSGETRSVDFEGANNPPHGGDIDAFVLKADSSGELEWMTYLGGSSDDQAEGIAVDSAGNGLVVGRTRSIDFDGRTNSFRGRRLGAFALKVDTSGHLEWMMYLGGTDGDQYATSIAVNAEDALIIAGSTASSDFEGRNNSHHAPPGSDAFVLLIQSSGQLQWMRYLGGGGADLGLDVAVDNRGNACICGITDSADFEGRNNAYNGPFQYDGFAARINAEGELLWMTFLGGHERDQGDAIAVDAAGFVYVSGLTDSPDFEGRLNSLHGSLLDAYLLKISSDGDLQWMRYLGGSSIDESWGIAVDRAGRVLVTGSTRSINFEGRRNSHFGGLDVFLLEATPSGQVEQMYFLGGRDKDAARDMAVDHSGGVVVAGYSLSTNFVGRRNASHGRYDAFVVKCRLDPQLGIAVAATCPSGGPIQIAWTDATPDGQVAVIFARNTGSFIIPNNHPCAGATLGLGSSQIQIAFRGNAGPDGSRILNSNAGPSACGGYLQLLDLTTCTTSNVARIE